MTRHPPPSRRQSPNLNSAPASSSPSPMRTLLPIKLSTYAAIAKDAQHALAYLTHYPPTDYPISRLCRDSIGSHILPNSFDLAYLSLISILNQASQACQGLSVRLRCEDQSRWRLKTYRWREALQRGRWGHARLLLDNAQDYTGQLEPVRLRDRKQSP
jgi:hypothetical protein